MSKMVNRLRLKQTLIRRFINNSDDEEEEECHQSSEIEIISEKITKHSEINSETNSKINSKNSSPSQTSKNNKFDNFKVFVKSRGETVQRVVDINGDSNPFIISDTLDKLLNCQDLKQMTTVLSKTSSDSSSNKDLTSKTNKGLNSKALPKGRPKRNTSQINKDLNNTSNENEDEIKELELEGIKLKKSNKFRCHVCNVSLFTLELATDHSKSDYHSRRKYGDQLKGVNALFTIDSEAIGDVKIAIHRERMLRHISNNEKQRYINHGIRLKDGFGPNAFICSKCNLCFQSLKGVTEHLNSFETSTSNQSASDSDFSPVKPLSGSTNKIDQKLHLEGIKQTEDSKFYCVFCNIYFDCKRIAVSHLTDTRHKRQKRSENLNEIDSAFTISSDRIDELEVAFARKTMLKTIPPKNKIEFTEQSIRLQDGIGENAFICQNCKLSIGSVAQIEDHLKSSKHSKL